MPKLIVYTFWIFRVSVNKLTRKFHLIPDTFPISCYQWTIILRIFACLCSRSGVLKCKSNGEIENYVRNDEKVRFFSLVYRRLLLLLLLRSLWLLVHHPLGCQRKHCSAFCCFCYSFRLCVLLVAAGAAAFFFLCFGFCKLEKWQKLLQAVNINTHVFGSQKTWIICIVNWIICILNAAYFSVARTFEYTVRFFVSWYVHSTLYICPLYLYLSVSVSLRILTQFFFREY